MIKKLRLKFIIIAFLSVLVVVAIIIGAINIVGYANINATADGELNRIAFSDPSLPEYLGGRFREKRYFRVDYDSEGNAVLVDVARTFSVDAEKALSYADLVYNGGGSRGTVDGYRYLKVNGENITAVFFLDYNAELSVYYNSLFLSLVLSASGLLLVVFLVVILSGFVFLPVEESYKKQKSFITNAGHDIKTPLTVIGTEVEVIEMENGETEWTKDIKKQIERLTTLTDKLVFLSKMDETGKIEKLPFDLSSALSEVVGSYEASAIVSGLKLVTQIESGITYEGEEDTLRQAVALLMDNAVKYAPKNSEIYFTLKKVGKAVEISVKNDAEDIAKGSHEEFFERFYRSESSRNRETGGNGIGLSVVRAIVNAHGGKITAKSEDGKTIEFLIIL